jgi:hypothetical protein
VHIEQKIDADFIELFCQALQSFAAFNNCAQILVRSADSSDFLRRLEARL